MSNKFILGGGISGLIFKYFNPNYNIISPNIGGQLKKHKNILMTFYIHNSLETKELLNKLNIKYKEKRLRIYYYYKNKVYSEIDNNLRLKFIRNKMSEYDYDLNSLKIKNLDLSTGTNYLDILDLDINKLIDKLSTDIIKAEVKLINNNRKFILIKEDNKLKKLNYDKLISTIPAKAFFNILYNYESNYKLRYLPATYILSKNKPHFVEEDAIYYVLDDNLIYNRVQKYGENYVYEITGIPIDEEIENNISNIIDKEVRYIGLIRDESIDDFRNIKFLGRLAQWDSSIKIQDIIKKAKKIKQIENEQKRTI